MISSPLGGGIWMVFQCRLDRAHTIRTTHLPPHTTHNCGLYGIEWVQWKLSNSLYNPDTNGAEESVLVSEVSSFQRLKCMQEW